MLVDPLTEQGTAGVGQRLKIHIPSRGTSTSQPLLPDHPGIQSAFDILRHAGHASAFSGGLTLRSDVGIQAYRDPVPSCHSYAEGTALIRR
jgi:hypothetical protein